MRVRIATEGWINVDRKAVQHIARCQANDLCLACEQPLGDSRVLRGCHERCCKATYRGIKSGKTTEQERMELGKLLPAESGGRRATNPVSVELAKSR
jgi:hypothetical protein